MKVKIVKCTSDLSWYKDKIGLEFEVVKSDFNENFVVSIASYKEPLHYIKVEDCEVIEDTPKPHPLGIKPARFAAEERIIEIAEAIIHYVSEGKIIPSAWLWELGEQSFIQKGE